MAEALLESGQLSTVKSGLAEQGIHLNLPSKPTLSEATDALEAMLSRNPEIVPEDKFLALPTEERRAEWATDQLSAAATASAGDFQ